MKQEFIIMDASVKYTNARNVLEEGLLYAGDTWTRKLELALKFESINHAIEKANALKKEAPVRVFMVQINGNHVGLSEINF